MASAGAQEASRIRRELIDADNGAHRQIEEVKPSVRNADCVLFHFVLFCSVSRAHSTDFGLNPEYNFSPLCMYTSKSFVWRYWRCSERVTLRKAFLSFI